MKALLSKAVTKKVEKDLVLSGPFLEITLGTIGTYGSLKEALERLTNNKTIKYYINKDNEIWFFFDTMNMNLKVKEWK